MIIVNIRNHKAMYFNDEGFEVSYYKCQFHISGTDYHTSEKVNFYTGELNDGDGLDYRQDVDITYSKG